MQFDHIKLHDAAPRNPLSAELADRLRELFAEDVARLGALLDRDLSAWLGVPPQTATARRQGADGCRC